MKQCKNQNVSTDNSEFWNVNKSVFETQNRWSKTSIMPEELNAHFCEKKFVNAKQTPIVTDRVNVGMRHVVRWLWLRPNSPQYKCARVDSPKTAFILKIADLNDVLKWTREFGAW